jgi:hypothetical protein
MKAMAETVYRFSDWVYKISVPVLMAEQVLGIWSGRQHSIFKRAVPNPFGSVLPV